MFARITPVFIALLAMLGATSVIAQDSSCKTVCCQSAGDAPSGWEGSDCQSIPTNGKCAYTKLCCYDIEGTSAADCGTPIKN